MFTDIVGYTALMQENEDYAVRIRDTHRRIFNTLTERYHGKIIQYFGDGTLSIFESAVQAVHCACEMQRLFQQEPRVPLRIGIHLGDIILKEDDIIGDAVNLASRVESIGVAGSVLITQKVKEEIYNKGNIEVVPMGTFHFKNDHRAREIYAVAIEGVEVPDPRKLTPDKFPPNADRSSIKPISHKKKHRLAFGLVMLVLVSVITGLIIQRQRNINWARYSAIPQIERLLDSMNVTSLKGGTGPGIWEGFQLLEQARKYLKDDPELSRLEEYFSQPISIHSDPAGAEIWVKAYSKPDSEWKRLGVTPIDSLRFPYGAARIKALKEDREPVEDVIMNLFQTNRSFSLVLPEKGSVPAGMVRAEGQSFNIDGKEYTLPNFLVDKYEVTNAAFKEFVDAGGYQKKEYWPFPFIQGGDTLSWEEAGKIMVDQTGRPGPGTWMMGTFPAGKEHHPVGGISWYEAAAFAKFSKKSLPTIYHFLRLKIPGQLNAEIFPLSNFSGVDAAPGGSYEGIQRFGVYDLGGNAREWVWNGLESEPKKLIPGGGWDDFPYMINHDDFAQDPMNRHSTNGFRCVMTLEEGTLPAVFFQPFHSDFKNEHDNLPPVSDEEYAEIIKIFEYDQAPFNEKIEYSRDELEWTRQKITFDPAYLGERMILYLFTPKKAPPPYQTIIYYPGGNAKSDPSSEQYLQVQQVEFLLKTGRAVAFPIYKGFYERGTGGWLTTPNLAHEEMVQRFKDLLRSIDYLCTREDVDTTAFGFYGISVGGAHGGLALALEKRIKAAVLIVAGLGPYFSKYDRIQNYLPRVKTPVLMLNGEVDDIFPLETSQKPFFELLGTPEPHKRLKLYPNGHLLPKIEIIKESLGWFDQYLGPVRFTPG